MLKRLKIDQFKSLNDFEINLEPITVVIGGNASGKSSLLQSIAFLKSCCTSSVEQYLNERNVTVSDIMSKLNPNKKILSFEALFQFNNENLRWTITFNTERTKNRIYLRSEMVTLENVDGSSEILLQYDSEKKYRIDEHEHKGIELPEGTYKSSLISMIPLTSTGRCSYQHLCLIYDFFRQTEPLDLLNPKNMRRSARGTFRTLGMSGEKLPALINNLSPMEQEILNQRMRDLVPQIENVYSVVHGVPGWAHLRTIEQYEAKKVTVEANGISDGTLRLLALASLQFLDRRGGITLLDEIEDGISSDNLKHLISIFRQNSIRQQILITTHSTVFLDDVDSKTIRYLYRNQEGHSVCHEFLDSPIISSKLEYLFPGEVVLNTTSQEIKSSYEEHPDD